MSILKKTVRVLCKSHTRNLYLGFADDSTTLKNLKNKPGECIKKKYKINLSKDKTIDKKNCKLQENVSNKQKDTSGHGKEKLKSNDLFYDI